MAETKSRARTGGRSAALTEYREAPVTAGEIRRRRGLFLILFSVKAEYLEAGRFAPPLAFHQRIRVMYFHAVCKRILTQKMERKTF